MEDFLAKAKKASRVLATLSSKIKRELLIEIGDELERNVAQIIEQNQIDLEYSKKANLSSSLIDRLLLDEKRVKAMANGVREIAKLREPVGRVKDGWINESGLKIEKVSVPIGVIGIIYESRPNVTADAGALCFKSGNVAILKGGKEAYFSNKIIAKIMQDVLEKYNLPKEMISILEDNSREGVAKLIKMDKFVDLIIPRGGEALIKFVQENATVPIVKHDKGLCHTYIHKSANFEKAIKISINAKTQRTGVCNAMETLLIDRDIADELLPKLKIEFDKYNTELRGCNKSCEIVNIKSATEEDFWTEYLDNILSIKVVENLNEAIEHINKYSSSHSDAIITENYEVGEEFLNSVDSACVYLNSSTRFTDGGEFGFGAEVGISTNKLHSRGPMGIDDLTTYKFKIYGNGQIRG